MIAFKSVWLVFANNWRQFKHTVAKIVDSITGSRKLSDWERIKDGAISARRSEKGACGGQHPKRNLVRRAFMRSLRFRSTSNFDIPSRLECTTLLKENVLLLSRAYVRNSQDYRAVERLQKGQSKIRVSDVVWSFVFWFSWAAFACWCSTPDAMHVPP